MPNMAYCRFRNTATDFDACATAMEAGEEDPGPEEKAAALALLESAMEMVRDFEDGKFATWLDEAFEQSAQ